MLKSLYYSGLRRRVVVKSEYINIGSPVDSWWNDMRACLMPCIHMLAAYPAAPDAEAAAAAMIQVNISYETVFKTPHPKQAHNIWTVLLDSLRHLHISLNAQTTSAMIDADIAHNLAYNRYSMVCALLLHRGIYEPLPSAI
jgi:hypothetical protein